MRRFLFGAESMLECEREDKSNGSAGEMSGHADLGNEEIEGGLEGDDGEDGGEAACGEGGFFAKPAAKRKGAVGADEAHDYAGRTDGEWVCVGVGGEWHDDRGGGDAGN